MKTVILTSSGWLKPKIRQEIVSYLPQIHPLKVAYISTASKVVKNDDYARRDMAIMLNLGFEVTEIDLAQCKAEKLPKTLSKSHVVYVQGGNGFYLLKHARQTGFIDIAKKLVEKGKLVYVGKSAGSYLACPTIEMHTWHSDKWDRYEVEDLTAMSLVDFLIQAHYSPQDDDNIIQGMTSSRYPIKLVTNDQALLIRGENITMLGDPVEYIYNNGVISRAAE